MTTQTADLYNLISEDTALKRAAGTDGGEFQGACPFCGGKDRFRVWPNSDRPSWWCRMCGKRGDAIQYLREKGHSYHDACDMLGVAREVRPMAQPQIAPPAECNAPSADWQATAATFVASSAQTMDASPLAYLTGRGLSIKTAAAFGLGYNPTGFWSERATWGLEPDGEHTRIWVPQGIVIPWYVGGELWKLQIRRDVVKPDQERYKTLPGSTNALYNVDSLRDGEPAVLVEGPFDALAVSQTAGDLVGVAACGTSGARRARWYSMLALCSPVLVALDADAAGDSASLVWCDILQDGKRHRPFYADPAQMLQDGGDVRGWVLAGLGRSEPQALTFTGIPLDYWRDEAARGCTASLSRLRAICEQRGADYDKTVAGLR